MDATQIVNQNLAPMLDAIRSYGQQIAKERDIEEQRQYQADLRREERTYQEGRTRDERAYQEKVRRDARDAVFADEARKRKIENQRTIARAFPSEDTSNMTDVQLESRALEATRKITRDDLMSKSESEVRSDAQKMGIPNFDKAAIQDLRKAVEDKKVQEQIDAKQKAFKAEEDFQGNRLATDAGKTALDQYNQLSRQKADLLKEMVSMSGTPDDVPIDKAAVGARAIQLLSGADMTMSGEEAEAGKKIYDALTDPRNKMLKTLILDKISAGIPPSIEDINKIPGIDERGKMFLSTLSTRAIADVTREDPKMIAARNGADRNSFYSRKFSIGEAYKAIDSEMARLTTEFPALRKIPAINMEQLTSPKPMAQPSGGVPGGPPVSAFPATRTPAPGGAVVAPASNVPASPVSDSPMSRIPGIETASPEFMGPPNLPGTLSAFQSRAKELAGADRRSGELAVDPLLIPLYQNIGAATGMRPEQVGASRFSVTVPDLVRRNLDASLGNFAALPPDVQNRAMLDAITKSYQEPQARRPLFGWQYESPFGR